MKLILHYLLFPLLTNLPFLLFSQSTCWGVCVCVRTHTHFICRGNGRLCMDPWLGRLYTALHVQVCVTLQATKSKPGSLISMSRDCKKFITWPRLQGHRWNLSYFIFKNFWKHCFWLFFKYDLSFFIVSLPLIHVWNFYFWHNGWEKDWNFITWLNPNFCH